MAIQQSIIKIKGTLDGFTFYKRGSVYLVRSKGGVDGARIASDPAFERSRENSQEFGLVARSVKTLRLAFRSEFIRVRDPKLTSRLTSVLHGIKNLDSTSVRGQRNVGVGIEHAVAKQLLKGFDFNKNAPLSSLLALKIQPDPTTGIVVLPAFDPGQHLVAPEGATHFEIRMCWAKIDFVDQVFISQESNVVNRSLYAPPGDLVLTPVSIPMGPGTSIFSLLLEFFQEVSGVQSPLQDGRHNALSIVEVL